MSGETAEEDMVWEVEAIRGEIGKGRRHLYHVKWVGFPESENTWEPAEELKKSAPLRVEEWEKRKARAAEEAMETASEGNEQSEQEGGGEGDESDESSSDCFSVVEYKRPVDLYSCLDKIEDFLEQEAKSDAADKFELDQLRNKLIEEKLATRIMETKLTLYEAKLRSLQLKSETDKFKAKGFEAAAALVQDLFQLEIQITRDNINTLLPGLKEKASKMKADLEKFAKWKPLLEAISELI